MLRCPPLGALLLLLVIVATHSVTTGADEKKSTELPLSRVVMFSSGVGFYEHNGEMQGDGQVTLKFNVEDINDLLQEHGAPGPWRRQDQHRELREQGPDHQDAQDVCHRPDQQPDTGGSAQADPRREGAGGSADANHGHDRGCREAQGPRGQGRSRRAGFFEPAHERRIAEREPGISQPDPAVGRSTEQRAATGAGDPGHGALDRQEERDLEFSGPRQPQCASGLHSGLADLEDELSAGLEGRREAVLARLGDRGEHDRAGLERREPDVGQRPADLVHHGFVSAAVCATARGAAGAVCQPAAAGV